MNFHMVCRLNLYVQEPNLLLHVLVGIDRGSVRLLEQQGNTVHDKNKERDQNTRGFTVPQGTSQEAQGQTVVHGVVVDVEREQGDSLLHQNAEVVPQIGAGDSERPHG